MTAIELHSRPDAPYQLVLDLGGRTFDYWIFDDPAYRNIVRPAYTHADDPAAVRTIWQIAADALKPWNVDVTTQVTDAVRGKVAVVVIGNNSGWPSDHPGGYSETDGLNSLNHNAGYGNVFPDAVGDDPANIGKAAIHEAGHLFGLHHQPNGIMASSPYGQPMVWSNEPDTSGRPQDDIAILTALFGLADTTIPPIPMIDRDCKITIDAPDTVQAGQKFKAQITVKNIGSRDWVPWDGKAGFNLGTQQPRDNTTWGPLRLPLPAIVPSGQTVVLAADFVAPTTPGDCAFAWDMVEELVAWFGRTTTKTIHVVAGNGVPVTWNGVPGIWTPTGASS